MGNAVDAEYIAEYICPLCRDKPRNSTSCAARRALMEHLRRPIDNDHKLWFDAYYKKHFPVGGCRKPVAEINEVSILRSIHKVFGEAWSNRISIQ